MSDTSDKTEFSRKTWLLMGLVFAIGLSILFFVAKRASSPKPDGADPVVTAPDDPVIARLNGDVITESQLALAQAFFSQENPNADMISRETALNRLIQQRLLAQMAKEKGLVSEPKTQNRVRFARDMILAEDAMDGFLASAVTDEEVRSYYDQENRKWAGRIQVKARQIVLPDEVTAFEITRRLDKGESFASLALAYSLDRASRESGGDLGYLNRDVLDPLLTEKIFAAEDGDRIDRFETAQGWHVVEVTGRRKAPIISFEQRESDIRSLLQAQKLQARLSELKSGGNLEILTTTKD